MRLNISWNASGCVLTIILNHPDVEGKPLDRLPRWSRPSISMQTSIHGRVHRDDLQSLAHLSPNLSIRIVSFEMKSRIVL